VIALGLIRRKIAKNLTDLIRRKFSIDGDDGTIGRRVPHPPIRNHTARSRGNLRFTICARKLRKMAVKFRCVAAECAALAFV
jgi:hypothetical protein